MTTVHSTHTASKTIALSPATKSALVRKQREEQELTSLFELQEEAELEMRMYHMEVSGNRNRLSAYDAD